MPEQQKHSRRISDTDRPSTDDDEQQQWILPNNAVAQSDLEVALQAIEETFQHARIAAENTSATRDLFLQDTQASLIQHLMRVVQSVDDQEFQDFVDLYHVVPDYDDDKEDEDKVEENDNDGDDDTFQEVLLFDKNGEEVDEADMVDKKSLHEAKQKRAEVRALSQSIQETRERVLEGSLETIMKKEYHSVLEKMEQRPHMESNAKNDQMAAQQQAALTESLETLSKLLQDSQWDELPKQLESLQNTIDVIQKESDPERPMSQIEAAIISRTNSEDDEEHGWEQLLSQVKGDVPLDNPATAAERLVNFFALFE